MNLGTKRMRIGELIAELQKWPADGDACIARQIDGIGAEPAYPIVGVSGFAGSRIDGADSGVTIELPAFAYLDDDASQLFVD